MWIGLILEVKLFRRKAALIWCFIFGIATLSALWAGCSSGGSTGLETDAAVFTQSASATIGASTPAPAEGQRGGPDAPAPAASIEPAAGSYALIYNGPVAASGSTEALADVAAQAGLPVQYVSNIEDLQRLLPDAKVFIIGGTQDDLSPLVAAFTPAATAALKDYLQNGGRYLGICGGGYMASSGWTEDGKSFASLGIIPAGSGSYLGQPEPQILPINWLGQTHQMYYQDGPVFYLKPGAEDVRIIAQYANGQVAAFLSAYGRGKVAVSGPHPEARQTWVYGEPNADSWTPSTPLAVDLLKELLSGKPINQ